MQVVKAWAAKRITALLGLEEEVLIGMVHAMLDEPNVRSRMHAWMDVHAIKRACMPESRKEKSASA